MPGRASDGVIPAIDSIGHVASIDDFAEDARQDRLPAVSWVDPVFLTAAATLTRGAAGRHAGRPAVRLPPGHRLDVQPQLGDIGAVHHLRRSRRALRPRAAARRLSPRRHTAGASEADLGGFDRYGFRVPLFVVSPYAKAHFVSHAVHSHTSILRFIETRFGLPALTGRDANADALLDMFDFANPPFLTPPDLVPPPVDDARLAACVAQYGR